MRHTSPFTFLAIILITTVLCCVGEQVPTSTAPSVRDSLGIRIVENSLPLWETEGSGWTLDSVPFLRIEADPENRSYYLGSPVIPQIMEDGRVLVPDRLNKELMFFDSTGILLNKVGRPGQGPGEFQAIWDVFHCSGDTLVVQEVSRVSFFDAEGTFARTERVAGRLTEGRGTVEGVSPDCSALLISDNQYYPPFRADRIHLQPHSLHWVSLKDLTRDTVLEFGFKAFPWDIGDQLVSLRLPFGEIPAWAVNKDYVSFGAGDRFEILQFDRSGEIKQIIRWSAQRLEVTDADRDKYSEGRGKSIDEYPSEIRAIPPIDHFPRTKFKPAFAGLLHDDEGNLWVRQFGSNDYPFAGAEPEAPERWWVFDPEGQWLGSLSTPARFKLQGVKKNVAIGIFWDEVNLRHVLLYRLNKVGTP